MLVSDSKCLTYNAALFRERDGFESSAAGAAAASAIDTSRTLASPCFSKRFPVIRVVRPDHSIPVQINASRSCQANGR